MSFAVTVGSTPKTLSRALVAAMLWGVGQTPQILGTILGISSTGPADAEPLEAAQLRHLEIGVLHIPLVVEEDVDLAVPLQPCYRIYRNSFTHAHTSRFFGCFSLLPQQRGRRCETIEISRRVVERIDYLHRLIQVRARR